MAVKKISLMDPTARASIPEGNIAPRLEELDGKVAGFLDNGKPNADILLARVEELLSGRCRLHQIVRKNKPVAAPSARSVMDELVRRCSFVVIGAGDWGSCTSWCIHDAVELERKGVPTVTICTDEFASLASAEAKALGLPTLPIARIAHPLGGISPGEARLKAETAIEEVIYGLTQPKARWR